jgi:hypothetical protein
MMRVGAEDRRQVETSINGTLYRARDGYFEMPDHHAKAHLRSGNLPTPAIGRPPRRGTGYTCTGCRRGTYFTTCGNCGSPAVREP